MDPSAIVDRENGIFTTIQTVNPKVSLDELVSWLRERHVNGEIRVLINNGGKQKVLFTQHSEMKPADTDKVRKILGFE